MKRESKPTIVIDTNLLVSALITRGTTYDVLQAWRRKEYILLTSVQLLAEVQDVLHRERIVKKYHIYPYEREAFLKELQVSAHVLNTRQIQPLPIVSRDPKDDMVLACAMSGNAAYLLTRDHDLLVLQNEQAIQPLKIVTPYQFLKSWRKNAA